MILLLLLVIIIPSSFIITSLVNQSINTYNVVQAMNIQDYGLSQINDSGLVENFGLKFEDVVKQVSKGVKDYFVNEAPNILGSMADILLGLFIMFFVMFFAYIDGEKWFISLKNFFPMKNSYKEQFFNKIKNVTQGVIYGQALTAIIQGSLGGLMLWIFGVQNAIFWGFIMIILSFFPIIGTPIVWLPIALIKLFQHNYVSGVGILIVGFSLIINIDSFLKPILIADKTKIHKALILIGVLGGLKLFGFIGLILGPLILALLGVLLTFDYRALGLEKYD